MSRRETQRKADRGRVQSKKERRELCISQSTTEEPCVVSERAGY